MLRVPGAAVIACTALALCACSGGSDDGDQVTAETAVLGTATERDPTPTSPPATEPTPSRDTTVTETDPEWVREPAATTPAAPTPTPAPRPTAPPQETDPPEDEPEELLSGSGWSMNTLLPDEDGEGWTEVGGQPPIDADGTSAERLFAQLAHEHTQGDAAGRHARCRSWLEATGSTALRARGEVVLELLVGDDSVARSVDHVDLTLGPGQRHDLPAWQQSIRLHAAEGETVTCSAWFFETGA